MSIRPLGNQSGQLLAPVGFILTIFVALGAGTLILRVKLREVVKTQKRIDSCVQARTMELMRLQNQIAKSNSAIRYTRYVIAGATGLSVVVPVTAAAIPALKLALKLEAGYQFAELMVWRGKQLLWVVHRGCDSKGDGNILFDLLPYPNWVRPPDDWIGPHEMNWSKSEKKEVIRLSKGNRRSAAEVYEKENKRWEARWTRYPWPILD
ncbi:MAG: hypothetical protein EOP09_07535 [Proteobacteria bacterium]|nr:MAG: hypothetical protein EOP09_07535 [Pseudomonadota bacterium]